MRAKDARELKAAFIDQTERLTGRLQVADTALAGIVDIADRARTTLVQRLDGNLGDAVPLDAEVDAMLQEIEAALNTRLDRQYLFAGSRTDARAGRAAGDADHHRGSRALLPAATSSSCRRAPTPVSRSATASPPTSPRSPS